ncbi:MAG: hypothetical protein SGILL_010405, partial [Bacillariaceae sp.]
GVQIAKQKHHVDDFHPELVQADIPTLYQELYRTVTRLYLATRNPDTGVGNFLILHLITSLWGLEKVLQAVERGGYKDVDTLTRKAIAAWWANLICFLAGSTGGMPSVEKLQKIQQGDFADTNISPNDNLDWSDVVQRGIAEEEEHNIKLVYVAKELWNRYGHWHPFFEVANSFTTTPNIGPATPQYDDA